MALDFSKLHDAIGKVADLAKTHADSTALVAAHTAELAGAQKQVDDLVAQLLAAMSTPAEAHGIAAVATALNVAPAPGVTVAPAVAPVATPLVAPAPVAPIVAPVAPVAPVIPAVAPVAPAATQVSPSPAPVAAQPAVAAPVAPLPPGVAKMAPASQTFLPGDPRALKH